jgi:putative intracellular protease/amidase
MIRWTCTLFAAALLAPLPVLSAPPLAPPPRVLLVVSGAGRDQGKTRPGFEMGELAQSYLVLAANGFDLDIASPQGGVVDADGYNRNDDFIAAFLADSTAVRKLRATIPTRDVRSADYAAVYIMGGKGAMFDLPADTALQRVIRELSSRDGIVAAVCHGPAAFAMVRRADGTPFVAGRRMTGFTNEEETAFGKRWTKEFPFALETALSAAGARWEEKPLMLPHLVVDAKLITGQNPSSTVAVAEALVRATGRTPVARTPWRDERTLALVTRFLGGDSTSARRALRDATATHHVQLIGMLGFYQSQHAGSPDAIRSGLSLMYLAAEHWNEPQLTMGIARAHVRLGETPQARQVLTTLLTSKPDLRDAQALRDSIGR